ncbi:hypothetical protein [Micromonospora sp. LOL_015]|uniref:hypothetical protein n=1 Tax=Micromonospora sp. LOL_015 TaxID=3345416 RepID=UPI003A8AA193
MIFAHAAVKVIRRPTVDHCVWSSPERIGTSVAVAGWVRSCAAATIGDGRLSRSG